MAKQRKRTDTGPSDHAASDRHDVQNRNGDHRDRVAARAYELYLERGGDHGRDWDDWLAAERELLGGPNPANPGHEE